MPLSSLSDPVDVARAQAALDTVWNEIRSGVPDRDHERERTRLAYIVASFVHVALDEYGACVSAGFRPANPI